MLLALVIFLPALLGALAWLMRDLRQQLWLLVGTASAHLALTASFWLFRPSSVGFFLSLDALGLLFLSLMSALFLAASIYSVSYLRAHAEDDVAIDRYVPFLLWFLAAMTLVTVTQHLALMWAAVEATTLASAPLIYFHRRRAALEAAWKYLLICSVGIALALLGTFFLGIAASAVEPTPPLVLGALAASGKSLALPWLKAAFVLAIVGYGTKMGLAPLHTWLPDAHSQAPSPVSALLSGALLNCALLGILRFYQVCTAAGADAFARTLLLTLGFVSLGVAAALIVGQRDYKRLLAYSSVENMGIIAAGIGVGGAATFGAMLHAVNHSLTKAGLFFLAGNLLQTYGTTRAAEVRGAARRLPMTGALLVLAMLAIGGSPPFGPFVSEYLIFVKAFEANGWLGGLFAALLAIAFLGMAGVLLPMAQGKPADDGQKPEREPLSSIAPSLALLAAVLVLGVWIPPFLSDLLKQAAGLLGG